MLHVRERLVVDNLLDEALRRPGGQTIDFGYPGFERRGVKGIREEAVIFSFHLCTDYRGNVLMVVGRGQGWGCHVTLWDGKVNMRMFPGLPEGV